MALTTRRIFFRLGFVLLLALAYVGLQSRHQVQDFVKRPFQNTQLGSQYASPHFSPAKSDGAPGVLDSGALLAPPKAPEPNTDAVLYVYFEGGKVAPRNFKFFLEHALHDKADFYFIINGHKTQQAIPDRPNIHIIRRDNTCYDLGTFGEVLNANDGALKKKYKRFILTNASIRGPFMPGWSSRQKKACWSDALFGPLKGNTKLVGLTANCETIIGPKHLQSFALATDQLGLEAIMPSLDCFENKDDAIAHGETMMTKRLREAGWDAVPLYSEYQANGRKSNKEFWEQCTHIDIWYPMRYSKMDVHPFDTLFVKIWREGGPVATDALSKRGMQQVDDLTRLMDETGFSSYDHC